MSGDDSVEREPVDAEIEDPESSDAVEPEDELSSELDGAVDGEPIGEWTDADDGELASIGDLSTVLAERDGYLDSLRRLQAEFDNFRKRTTRQQSELLGRASEALIGRLLPVLDALDLALVHAGESVADSSAGGSDSGQALGQIASLMRDVLAKEGLERIDAAEVAFDPTLHDAVLHIAPDPEQDQQGEVVAEIMRAGYSLNGRVLRPAMVSVRG